MNTKFSLLFFLLVLSAISSRAQIAEIDPDAIGYYTDALRFSQTTSGGTARFMGMGGVNNALGADLSSLAGNPAGLGFYQKSEIGISPAFGFGNTSSQFIKGTFKDQRDYFYIPSFGMVFNGRKSEAEEGAFRGGSFGIGLTRIANFQNQFSYSGTNTDNSIADYFVEITNGTAASDLDDYDAIQGIPSLAYYAFMIDPVDPDDPFETRYQYRDAGHPRKQEETVLTKGAINQWNFAYGGNFNDKVYIGASIGVPVIRYKVNKYFKETVIGGDSVDNFRFNEELNVRGTGINFKMGMIIKPEDWVRIGFSLQTPTYFGINEDYIYVARSTFKGNAITDNSNEKTEPGEYKYNLTTPLRASAGIALFAGKAGFISADIEYVPYSRSRLKENSTFTSEDNSTFTGDNRTINNIYKPAVNINVGGELRHKIYRFRGGFAVMGDGYNNIDDVNRRVINISGGAGIRLENHYIDFALVNSRFNSSYRPYTLANGAAPTAYVKNTSTSLIISAGVFF